MVNFISFSSTSSRMITNRAFQNLISLPKTNITFASTADRVCLSVVMELIGTTTCFIVTKLILLDAM